MIRPERGGTRRNTGWTFREDPVTIHGNDRQPSLRPLSLEEGRGAYLSVLMFIHNAAVTSLSFLFKFRCHPGPTVTLLGDPYQ